MPTRNWRYEDKASTKQIAYIGRILTEEVKRDNEIRRYIAISKDTSQNLSKVLWKWKIFRNKRQSTSILYSIGNLILQWIVDALLIEEEETWDKRNVYLRSIVRDTMEWTCEQRRCFRENENKKKALIIWIKKSHLKFHEAHNE